MKKDKMLKARMDSKLYEQLKRYADKNDDSLVSVSARKAITKFLKENTSLKSGGSK